MTFLDVFLMCFMLYEIVCNTYIQAIFSLRLQFQRKTNTKKY